MKKISRRTTKRTQIKLTPKEANEIIRQEFEDSKGNPINIKYDFTPHKPSEPTIKIERQYEKE